MIECCTVLVELSRRKTMDSVPNELRLKAGGLEFNKQVRNIEF